MSWAFDGVPWSDVPDSEKFAIWQNQALVRDSFLTDYEFIMKLRAIDQMKSEQTK